MEKIKVEQQGFFWFWLAGALFTIGFLQMGFWKAVLALAVWPYFLGLYFAG